ncbi:Golgi-associated RAB2 interactor protein 5B-like isoform X2 [Monodelphis domestica]|uniref:Golgi-associated RAB2 interactor protein 5B-like isoform X2 n=1 Tax=Monodelphis domestica TaxID=13616 RepID=UPI0024E1CFB4|nr:Golgi-associated RAB2 interactor protein 5B-like isoform X2 [Monodelphis domestica]
MRSQWGPPGCVTPARLPLLSSAVPESHSQSALPTESILALLQQPPPPPPQSPDLQAHRDSLSPMKPRKPSPGGAPAWGAAGMQGSPRGPASPQLGPASSLLAVVLPGELHLPEGEVEEELSFPLCFPKPGPLQRALAEGNYPPLGPFTAMFESDFVQVTPGRPVGPAGGGRRRAGRRRGASEGVAGGRGGRGAVGDGRGGGGRGGGDRQALVRVLPAAPPRPPQVTNKGEPVFLHKKENPVTMAVASSFPGLLLPDLVLLARPVQSKKQPPRLELTRLLPAHLVRLFVHSEAGWRLKLRLASGRSFYLRLVAEPAEGCLLFNLWRFLIFLMQGPIAAWARSPDEQAAQDESAPMSAAEAPPKRKEVAFPPQYPVPRTKGSPGWTWDKALHYPGPLSQLMDQQTTPALPEVMLRAEAAPMPSGSQQKLPVLKEEERKRSTPGSLVEVEGQPSITVRTLFRRISSTLSRSKAASPAETSSSGPSRSPSCSALVQTLSSWLGSREVSKSSASSGTLQSSDFSMLSDLFEPQESPQEQPQPQEGPQERPPSQEHPRELGNANRLQLPQEQPQPQEQHQAKERDSSGEPRTLAEYVFKKLEAWDGRHHRWVLYQPRLAASAWSWVATEQLKDKPRDGPEPTQASQPSTSFKALGKAIQKPPNWLTRAWQQCKKVVCTCTRGSN